MAGGAWVLLNGEGSDAQKGGRPMMQAGRTTWEYGWPEKRTMKTPGSAGRLVGMQRAMRVEISWSQVAEKLDCLINEF